MSDTIGLNPQDYYTRAEAERYDRSRSIRKIQADLTLNLLHLMNIRKGSKILDAGCGSGISTEILNNQHRPIGIDISKQMIHIATKKDIPVIQASFNNIPFKDSSFDALISVSALQWLHGKNSIEEKEIYLKAIHEFHRILKKDATGGIQFYPSKEGLGYDTIVSLFKKSGFSCNIIKDESLSHQKKGHKYLIIKKI